MVNGEGYFGISVQENERQVQMPIMQISSEEILKWENIEKYGLKEFVKSYEMEREGWEDDREYIQELMEIEYGQKPGGETLIYMVLDSEGRAAASISYTKLDRNDAVACEFFDTLANDPVTAEMVDPEDTVLYTRGVVVRKDMFGKGVASKLMKTVVNKLNPTIILGETKTESAVAIRANLSGYDTAYGSCPLNSEQMSAKQKAVLAADLTMLPKMLPAFRGMDRDFSDQGVFTVDTGYLEPGMPEPDAEKPILVKAFHPLIEAQRKLDQQGVALTAVLPLISIRKVL